MNVLLIRYAGGWHEVTDVNGIARDGRSESTLSLGATQSVAEVDRLGNAQLAYDQRESIAVDLVPLGPADTPYRGFDVGDLITVPDSAGTATVERVVSLTVTEDDNGRLSYAPELHDVILSQQQRMEQAIARMASGALAGTSPVATPMQRTTAPAPIASGAPAPPVAAAGMPTIFIEGSDVLAPGVDTSLGSYAYVSFWNSGHEHFRWASDPAASIVGQVESVLDTEYGLWLATFYLQWMTYGGSSGFVAASPHVITGYGDGENYDYWSFGPYELTASMIAFRSTFGLSGARSFRFGPESRLRPFAYQGIASTTVGLQWYLSVSLVAGEFASRAGRQD